MSTTETIDALVKQVLASDASHTDALTAFYARRVGPYLVSLGDGTLCIPWSNLFYLITDSTPCPFCGHMALKDPDKAEKHRHICTYAGKTSFCTEQFERFDCKCLTTHAFVQKNSDGTFGDCDSIEGIDIGCFYAGGPFPAGGPCVWPGVTPRVVNPTTDYPAEWRPATHGLFSPPMRAFVFDVLMLARRLTILKKREFFLPREMWQMILLLIIPTAHFSLTSAEAKAYSKAHPRVHTMRSQQQQPPKQLPPPWTHVPSSQIDQVMARVLLATKAKGTNACEWGWTPYKDDDDNDDDDNDDDVDGDVVQCKENKDTLQWNPFPPFRQSPCNTLAFKY